MKGSKRKLRKKRESIPTTNFSRELVENANIKKNEAANQATNKESKK